MGKPIGAWNTVPYALQARTTALRFAVEAYHHARRIHDADHYAGAADRRRRAAALAEEHLRLADERDYLRREWAARRG